MADDEERTLAHTDAAIRQARQDIGFLAVLPDQAGSKIMQVVTPVADDTPYGPWGGLAIMALWVVAALLGGYLLLEKRDA